MQLTIPPDLEELIEQQIATGAFENAEQVLRSALQAQAFENDWTEEERQAISDRLEESYQQAERGELTDGDQVKIEMTEFKKRWIEEH
jgi:Arc/MetJ-type ribon-helix-helix transcriptional regulator